MCYPEDAQEGNLSDARGFLLSTQTLGVVRTTHVLPEKKLGPISWKKQKWKQNLIHNILIFVGKVLLKACLAVSSGSVS